jgi:retron-type reverse transcriptase
VSTLEALKNAASLDDLAAMLGYKPSALSYIVYKLPSQLKYTKFEIPKRSGGVRQISAPHPKLRTLQRRLANILYACRDEIDADGKRGSLSHGFRRKHSIVTNARPHKRRRYVLNLDLQDFFPSFNFGRVRGFFIKNYHFALTDKVATIIAQIACHENMLPQGSPCSPVIADLIAHPMDVRLAQLAKEHKLTYTRYADDLTFSTGQKEFPTCVAWLNGNAGSDWVLGEQLVRRIEKAGFKINPAKTRMQVRTGRQLVTGLTVNAKVNIRADYYRHARSMCHSLFRTGAYHQPDAPGAAITSLNPLEGILSHIHHVKDAVDGREPIEKIKDATALRRLYARFLAYRLFARLEEPLIVCEGKTDNVYLKYAIRSLTAFHPKLGSWSGKNFVSTISFFNYGNHAHKILQLNGGTGDLKHMIRQFAGTLAKFEHKPLAHPVVILIDNDDGAKEIFSVIKERYKKTIDLNSSDDFYHITDNLYLVKTPEKGNGQKSCIEDCFPVTLLATKLNGKSFNPAKESGSDGEYGKHVFAEKVVRPNAGTVDFSGFEPLLKRLVAVIDDYKPPTASSAAA